MNRKSCLFHVRAVALLVATAGLAASPVAAARWTPLGPPDGATVLSLAFDPTDPSTVYAGTAGGGVSKSRDGGRTWAPSSFGLGDPTVNALAVDPLDPRKVYAGTEEGLFRSRDRGRSWLPSGMKLHVYSIALDPNSSGSLYVGTSNGMYRSFDGGLRWVRMDEGLFPRELKFHFPSVVVAPSRPRTLYAAHFGHRSGVFRSRDGGRTWRRILNAEVWHLAVDPFDANVLYASGGGPLWRTTDGGGTWSKRWLPEGAGKLALDPSGTVCIITRGGASMSYDQGAHWQPLTGLEDRLVQILAFNPQEPARILAGTYGQGVIRSEDAGLTWEDSSTGLVTFTALAVAVVPERGAIFTGAWSGLYRSFDGGVNWQRVIADFAISSLAVAPTSPDTIYAGVGGHPQGEYETWLLKSTDGGDTWQEASAGLHFGPVVDLAVDPRNPATVYAGVWPGRPGLFRSTDGGATWKGVPNLLETAGIAFDPLDSRVIYITQRRGLFHSRDGGQTWKKLMFGESWFIEALRTKDVAVAPSDPNRLAVIDDRSVFLSKDAGRIWVKSDGCPAAYNSVVFDPKNADVVYIGTEKGIRRTLDGGTTWADFSQGLPAVHVYSLVFDPADPTKLYAGTGAAGVFLMDLAP